MKHTRGRLRILEAMAKPGAYARPNLSVTGLPPQCYRITPNMLEMFSRAKMIAEAKPPKTCQKEDKHLGYVFVITDKGRDWMTHGVKLRKINNSKLNE